MVSAFDDHQSLPQPPPAIVTQLPSPLPLRSAKRDNKGAKLPEWERETSHHPFDVEKGAPHRSSPLPPCCGPYTHLPYRKPTKNSSELKGFPARGGGHDFRRRAARGHTRRTHGVRWRFLDGCGEVGGAVGGASALIATTFRPTAVTSGSWQAMSKRAKMTEPEVRNTIVGSYIQFRIDYEQIKQLPIGKRVHSDVVSAGGHLWRIHCYPHGARVPQKGEYVSIFLVQMSKSRSVRVKFEVFLMGGDGKPSTSHILRICETFKFSGCHNSWGWSKFIKLTELEKDFLIEGYVTFSCTIMVMDDSAIPVPPSDIGTHLGRLLDHTDGTDVSFIVDGEKFPAHRAVLAARSPVFRAELFGSMAEATMSSITLQEITPATFKAMLRFIYTDELPAEDAPEDSSIEMFQNLLFAADRYALDRLKLICAQKLWDKVSVDTVATILACAETYNCRELKNNCIDFFAVEENFKEAMFTDGYAQLVLKFPSVTAELKKRVKA
uniref:Uncharacterized protein n=1 Tax=Avena sativa TaxID=4498 RepID=A0ACD5VNY5_AVESA